MPACVNQINDDVQETNLDPAIVERCEIRKYYGQTRYQITIIEEISRVLKDDGHR